GFLKGVGDLEAVPVRAGPGGVPVRLADLATVQMGGDLRRGVLERDGEGEVVGGIVVMRSGENAQAVIDRVKARLEALKPGLPPGVAIRVAYDRSDLIGRAVDTLRHTLVEEAIAVSLVVLLFLWNWRGALVIVVAIPVAVLASFIAMWALGITSNVM